MSGIGGTENQADRLSEAEAREAQQAGEAITAFLREEGHLRLTLSRDTGEQIEASVPAKALRLLPSLLREISLGKPVSVVSRDAELTTRQAAEVLQVSRPHLVKLLDSGRLPFRKVGTHRRIRFDDVLTYQEQERARRRQVMEDLVVETERLGLYG